MLPLEMTVVGEEDECGTRDIVPGDQSPISSASRDSLAGPRAPFPPSRRCTSPLYRPIIPREARWKVGNEGRQGLDCPPQGRDGYS
ncbi:hypothetical protein GGTG_04226 [Gaeumannomyces tritici R3-111a-1]|uniref:Uncharacterized protein n=1 Tax=Gaeumannomyces tritici (strain R3-111a-1) TaxID=644352 RepID=J3NSH4_GAET3|nr:hypothetical protein GGTG_04226 [Gaeumannomyces tritici R3-111a-1]EJT79137.1 hypothetical protein GGTG_04226 [Gaeumannomyces tritici R3-111a-1]